MDIEDKKIYSDKWFSYLQEQICNQFEKIEKTLKVMISLFQPIGIKKIIKAAELTKY